MNPLIQPKKATPLFLIALVLACFALSPERKRSVPAPDGGYPGGNTAEGQSALLSLTTGTSTQQLVGFRSDAASPATSTPPSALGRSLPNRRSKYGHWRCGAFAQHHRSFNTANGAFALLNNTSGNFNTANGSCALPTHHGSENTANGDKRSLATPAAGKTRPPVLRRSLTTPPATTRLMDVAYNSRPSNTANGASAL